MEGKNLRSMFTVMIWDTKVLIGLNVLVSHRESIISSVHILLAKPLFHLRMLEFGVLERKALHESSKLMIFVEHVPLGAWIQFRTQA